MPLLAVRGNGPAGAYGFGAASEKAAAMTAIASTTLSTTATSVTLSSIPGTYDDLRLVMHLRVNTGGGLVGVRFNADTGGNYSDTILRGDGTYASSHRDSNSTYFYPENTGATRNVHPFAWTMDVLNYANTSNNKTALMRFADDRNGQGESTLSVGLWRSTSAITSITILNSDYSFTTGSVFALYGIKKAA